MPKHLSVLLIFIFSLNIFAQKYFSGEISRDTHWIGDVHIDGDVIVPRGVILSIESGSRVFFKPHYDSQHGGMDKERAEIIVNGVLLARGAGAQTPILFSSESSQAQMNDWYGIILKNLNNKSILKNCVIEFGYKGITCYGSVPLISDSEIRFNYNSGISCEVRAKPEIENCVIVGNGFSGINAELASSPQVSGCTITQNTYGVMIFSRSEPDLGHFPKKDGLSKGENRIYNNFDFDVYNHSTSSIYAQNNIWSTKTADEIRTSIYDTMENPAYGQVIFEPQFSVKKTYRYTPFATAQNENTREASDQTNTLAANEGNPPKEAITANVAPSDTIRPFSGPKIQDSVANKSSADTVKPDIPVKAAPETVYVYKPPEPKKEEKKVIHSDNPVLEAFLDSGKREYARRVKPEYPGIYLKTGTEGDVFIEVIVGKDGNVSSYHVLKSDGELFTASAIDALKRTQYKPGTVNGVPVKYKIVERFRFKRSTN